jgi:hypothetical protein
LDTLHQPYKQIVKLNWKSWYEFRENYVLTGDFYWLMPVALGGNFNFNYLFSKGDFTPYVTGGLGMEYVYNDKDFFNSYNTEIKADTKRYSGPSLNIGLGYLVFRTYDIHLFGQLTYNVIFNDDMDNGITAEIGTVYRPVKKEAEAGKTSCWTTGLYVLGGLLIVDLLIASAH